MRSTNHALRFRRLDDASRKQRPRRAGRFLPALVLLGSALGALAAAAQTAPRGTRAVIDTNNDGVLDEHELRAARAATFERADADGDGYLTADESDAARMAGDVGPRSRGLGGALGRRFGNAETADERFERLDADKDGRISEQEFVDAPHPLLRFDADGDGRVTREEIEDARKAQRRFPF